MTKKAQHTNQQQEIVEVLPTRSLSRFVRAIGWFPRLRSTSFRGWRLSDCRTWREGVLSFKYRRCNETKKYHRAQQSPHENDWLPWNENVHWQNLRGQRAAHDYRYYTAENPRPFVDILPEFHRSGN
jgi:hypothetical protein